jgi:hypothetical protein
MPDSTAIGIPFSLDCSLRVVLLVVLITTLKPPPPPPPRGPPPGGVAVSFFSQVCSRLVLHANRYPEEIHLDEDEATAHEAWRFEDPRRGWAIVRIKYSETLLKKRTRQYQAMALKLASADGVGGDARSFGGESTLGGSRLGPPDLTVPRTRTPGVLDRSMNGRDSEVVLSSDSADGDSDNIDDDDFLPEINRRKARQSMAPPSQAAARRKSEWPGHERSHLESFTTNSDVGDSEDRGRLTPLEVIDSHSTPAQQPKSVRIAQISV